MPRGRRSPVRRRPLLPGPKPSWTAWLNGWTIPEPADLAAWAKLPKALQLEAAGKLSASHAPLLPRAAYLFHAVRLSAFLAVFWLLLVPAEGATSVAGLAKLTGWASFIETLGIGTSTGPLMEGHHGTSATNALACLRDPFAPLRLRFTVGAVKNPLLPGLPMRRGVLDVLLTAGHIATLAAFLLAPGFHLGLLRLAVALLTLGCVLDRAVYCGCLGFHFYPMLLALAWAGDAPPQTWLALCQAVQLPQLFWAGVAKEGPWFRSGAIVSAMVGNGLLVPGVLRRAMFRDHAGGDLRPSRWARLLAELGVLTEIAAPVMAVWPGTGAEAAVLRAVGLLGCAGTHLFILFNVPLGSLQEWNTYTLHASLLLYHFAPLRHGTAALGVAGWPAAVAAHPLLGAFLFGTLYCVPLYGLFDTGVFWYAFTIQQVRACLSSPQCLRPPLTPSSPRFRIAVHGQLALQVAPPAPRRRAAPRRGRAALARPAAPRPERRGEDARGRLPRRGLRGSRPPPPPQPPRARACGRARAGPCGLHGGRRAQPRGHPPWRHHPGLRRAAPPGRTPLRAAAGRPARWRGHSRASPRQQASASRAGRCAMPELVEGPRTLWWPQAS